MARIIASQGACPVCAEDVLRTVHCIAGIQHEVYHCPAHGRLDYGNADVPLASLAAALESTALLAGGPHVQVPAETTGSVQDGTGIDLVC